jgi:O-antigen/teichoic acid export membrane protein
VAFLIAVVLFPLLLQHQGREVVRLSVLFALTAPVYIVAGYLFGIFQGCGRLRVWNVLRGISTAVWFAGIVVLAILGKPSVASMVLIMCVGHATAAIVALGVLLGSADWSEPTAWDLFRPLLVYGSKNSLAGVSWLANTRLDQLLMTCFLRPRQIGCYVAAVSLAGSMSTLAQAVAGVTLPRITACPDLAAARAITFRSVCGTVALLLPAAGCLYLAAPWLLVRIYGSSFSEGVPAVQILVFGTVALGLNYVLSEALRGLNRPLGPALGEIGGLVVSLLALWVLLPRLGITGAALASTASYTTVSILLAHYLRRVFAANIDHRPSPVLLDARANVAGTGNPLGEGRREDSGADRVPA